MYKLQWFQEAERIAHNLAADDWINDNIESQKRLALVEDSLRPKIVILEDAAKTGPVSGAYEVIKLLFEQHRPKLQDESKVSAVVDFLAHGKKDIRRENIDRVLHAVQFLYSYEKNINDEDYCWVIFCKLVSKILNGFNRKETRSCKL